MTYSIVARDPDASQWGVAVQSKFLSVGSVVPWAEAHVGALATQAYANPRYGPDGLALLREGLGAAEVVERLVAADDGRNERQLGVVDREGGSRLHGCRAASSGRVIAPARTTPRRGTFSSRKRRWTHWSKTFESSTGTLARRLIDCLQAAQIAGGDKRGQQSAALLIVQENGGYAGMSDLVCDLRVDDHERPIDELARLYVLHDRLFGVTPDEDWLPLAGDLAAEVESRVERTGYRSLREWAGAANLEDRVREEPRIDPVVLEALREATGA